MSQFHNVEPRTREERLAQQGGGERLEKARLRAKGIDAPANPLVPVKGSPQYADDNSRFQRDAAALEYERRQAQLARKEASELSHAVLGVASRMATGGVMFCCGMHGRRRCNMRRSVLSTIIEKRAAGTTWSRFPRSTSRHWTRDEQL